MTEKDAVEEIVKQSYTLKVDIEELRKWAKDEYYRACVGCDYLENLPHYEGRAYAYGRLIQKLDEIERGGKV